MNRIKAQKLIWCNHFCASFTQIFHIGWMQLTINFMYKVTAWCQRTLMDPNPISFLQCCCPSVYILQNTILCPPKVKFKKWKYFVLQDIFNMGILCFKTSFVNIDRIMLILEMIWSTKFELGTSNTSFNKRRRETKIHKWRST